MLSDRYPYSVGFKSSRNVVCNLFLFFYCYLIRNKYLLLNIFCVCFRLNCYTLDILYFMEYIYIFQYNTLK